MSGACLHWRGKTTGGGSKKIEPLDLERFWTIGIHAYSTETGVAGSMNPHVRDSYHKGCRAVP